MCFFSTIISVHLFLCYSIFFLYIVFSCYYFNSSCHLVVQMTLPFMSSVKSSGSVQRSLSSFPSPSSAPRLSCASQTPLQVFFVYIFFSSPPFDLFLYLNISQNLFYSSLPSFCSTLHSLFRLKKNLNSTFQPQYINRHLSFFSFHH